MRLSAVFSASTLALATVFASTAQAASTWSFACGGGSQPACISTATSSTSGVSSTHNYSGTGTTVTARVSGWGATGPAGDGTAGSRLVQGRVGSYGGGLGITSVGETTAIPSHGVDNGGPDEFMLVTFSQAVALTGVRQGWISGDGDLTVLAYTGTGIPNLTLNTLSSADLAGGTSVGLINNGWSLVSHPGTTSTAAQTHTINGGTSPFRSSYWLIGAYNASVANPNSALTAGDDFFKLLSVTGTIAAPPTGNPVPVPGTLALVALGLPLLRRRLAA